MTVSTGDSQILVVDDDPSQRDLLTSYLGKLGYRLLVASSGMEALELLKANDVAMMVSDVRMPEMNGLETLRRAREDFPDLPVLLVTGYADVRDAVEAMRDGAVNYLEKPIDLDELKQSLQAALGTETEQVTVDYELPENVVAESPLLRAVIHEVAVVAPTDSRILITGESGTGKEIVADLIHEWSSRSAKPFVIVNCAAIPENLLESELFGHEKGAFTGAVEQRIGRFGEAHGGTIFLDEIGEIPSTIQAKLLRVIQDGVFQRIGSNANQHTDTRVIAATNRNLEEDVEAGRFREDLFYRLNVIEVHLPPLRERPADIIPLAAMFAGRFSNGTARLSTQVTTALTLYKWPGNVRQLQNAMERAALMSRGGLILPEHLPRRIQKALGEESSTATPSEGTRMEEIERAVILQALRENAYNRSETARALGISRRALIYKLQNYKELGYSVDAGE